MSELIKENGTESMIDMVRLRMLTLLGLIFIGTLFLSAGQPIAALESGFSLSQEADIHAWGIEGEPELGNGFDVWANVSVDSVLNDDDPGLRNVTVQVSGPNMTLNNLMTFNGTFYTGSVPAFPNDGTFSVRIRAYDLANASRNSAYIYIDYESDPLPVIDPTVTMPIVVGSSIGLMAVVIGLAIFYDRKKVT
jgi:hypothetical protein